MSVEEGDSKNDKAACVATQGATILILPKWEVQVA